jgi:hypothetical protein
MSKCYNCGTEFTLKSEETHCDKCKKKVNFPCNACSKWFSIEGIKTCGFCGYYYCPECNTCSRDCLRYIVYAKIREIIPQITNEQLEKIKDYIEDLKTNKEQKSCPNGVPISYAKGRCKMCFVKLLGYGCKSEGDLTRFKERYEQVLDKDLGDILTINQSREDGGYGQEFRDVFNLAVCLGKLKKIKTKRIVDGKEIEFGGYQRIEEAPCSHFDSKDMVLKKCPQKDCKIKIFPYKEISCSCPECKYKKGKKVGQLRELKLKISNQDICQLNRGAFKKDGEGESSGISSKT